MVFKKTYLQLTAIVVNFAADCPIPLAASTMYSPWSEHFTDGISKKPLFELNVVFKTEPVFANFQVMFDNGLPSTVHSRVTFSFSLIIYVFWKVVVILLASEKKNQIHSVIHLYTIDNSTANIVTVLTINCQLL